MPDVTVTDYDIDQFRAGDHEAFYKIYNYYYPAVRYYAWKLTGSEEEAADIAQNSFEKLWKNRKKLRSGQGLKGFLYATAHNNGIDWLRKEQVRRRGNADLQFLLEEKVAPEAFAAEVTAEVLRRLREEIDKLPPKRAAIINRGLQEQNDADIANAMKTTASTVRSQRSRAIGQLKDRFGKKGFWVQIPFLAALGISCLLSGM